MKNNNDIPYDFQVLGDRRKTERRQQVLDRRGILRWDPQMKDRRLGRDRRRVIQSISS